MTDEPKTHDAIPTDTPCRRCGYNLRGLPPSSRCPECNLEIALSLKHSVLRYSNPKWVMRLRHGALLTGVGWLGLFNIPALLFVAGHFVNALLFPPIVWRILLLLGFMLFAGFLFAGGLYMAQQPPFDDRQPANQHRKFFIILSTIIIISVACRVLARFAGVLLFPSIVHFWWTTGLIVAATAVEYLRMRIVISLCELIPDDELAIEAKKRGRSFCVPFAVLSVGMAFQSARTLLGVNPVLPVSTNALEAVVGAIYFACSLVIFVSAILYGTFLIGLSRRLKQEADLATKNWSNP